jgi:ATP-binding cassette subfamily B protein
MSFIFYKQTDSTACGAASLRMVAKYYGREYSLNDLIKACCITREGVSLLGISDAAEKIGFRTIGAKVKYDQLSASDSFPCIAHWNQRHFVVIYKIKKGKVYIADPAHGLLIYSVEEFKKCWISDGKDEGIVLLLEPTPKFNKEKNLLEKELSEKKSSGFRFLFSYLFPHKRLYIQLVFGLLIGSLLQLVFPFLTQSIVDIGIQNSNVKFIYLILFAQLMLFFAKTTVEIIRNWILMHVSSRINISLVSDFFGKLMKLPIAYFDTKMTGDIMQRINDNERIEQFLTGSSLRTLFSMFNLIIFSGVLAWYSINIFLIFILGSTFYFLWIVYFLKRRADLDYKLFSQNGQNQGKIIELLAGMQEIKLHNAERRKKWEWEVLQVKLFKINLKSLSLSQVQNSGSALINELKNIIITFCSAKLVLDGQITLGIMLSISYISGQLNAPLLDLVSFIQQWQNAKLSLERLSEIHNKTNEEGNPNEIDIAIKNNADLKINNLSFTYEGAKMDAVLKNITFNIPSNKVTAIVGASGSGKTTLMKLLLKFYEPTNGEIYIGENNLKNISPKMWRQKCGSVMQEGYIFSDSIANNIALGIDDIDIKWLQRAAEIANIKEFIEGLPMGYNTKIGMEGSGLSTGQKQRILIARAVYKNPEYLFFDEATSALDANNEKIIMNNFNEFFKNKTVVIIAHRLSTVKNADHIIVLNKGEVIESGHHTNLTNKKGAYFELVKNQLELGN